MNIKEIIDHIETMLSSQERITLGISGFGGAGKTTLAKKLCQHFFLRDEQVLHLDHLYSHNPNGPGILDQVDWNLLEEILKQASHGERLVYQGRGFLKEPIFIDEKWPNLLIVEGIRLLQPKLMKFFDCSIWIDCPHSLAVKRAKRRDRSQGESEEVIARWDTDWGPKDLEYDQLFQPAKLASIIYSSSS